MKSCIILISAFFLLTEFSRIRGENLYTDFFPLKVGNVWVYTNSGMPPGPNKSRLAITGTYVVNGKVYYSLQLQFNTPLGCTPNPFSYSVSGVRIDSLTGNLTYNNTGGCSYSPDYRLIDSLSARKNDTFTSNCSLRFICTDTNSYTIFGVMRKTRKYRTPVNQTEYYIRQYVRNIGIYEQNHGLTGMIDCNAYLIGAVIDGVLYGDTSFPVGITQIPNELPSVYFLDQNFPNPFNPVTKIRFGVPITGLVKIDIFDVTGREVSSLVNQQLRPGKYEVEWNGNNYPSGIYFYKLTSGNFSFTKKMVLVK